MLTISVRSTTLNRAIRQTTNACSELRGRLWSCRASSRRCCAASSPQAMHSASVCTSTGEYDYDAVVAQAPDPLNVEWVFGYGSILFRQGFAPGTIQAGYIEGFKRCFYQASTDHRGTPEAPGRTVTLVPAESEKTWGIAYKLPEDVEERRRVLQELEWREKQYDLKVYADIYNHEGECVLKHALTYVGTSDMSKNRNWAGEAPLDVIAAQIASAVGPSGPNYQYLYSLADGLRALDVDDPHVFDLERLVRAIRQD